MIWISTLSENLFSTVGGLKPWSLKRAAERLHRGKSWSEDTPAKPSAALSAQTMHWVSPWRTTAINEDSSDWQEGDYESDSDSFTREWESQPKSLRDDYATDEKDWNPWSDSDVDIYMGEEEYMQEKWQKTDREYEGDWEEEGDEGEEEEEEEWDSSVSTEYHHALKGVFPLLQKGQKTTENSWGSEAELDYLRDGGSVAEATGSYLILLTGWPVLSSAAAKKGKRKTLNWWL